MTSLRERFDDAVADPTPPRLPSGDAVFETAWRRRRVRNRLVTAVVGGCTAAAMAAVLVVTTGGDDRAGPVPAVSAAASQSPSPTPRPTAEANSEPYFRDGLVDEAIAMDAGHLFAAQQRCVTATNCTKVLYGSDDGGHTWTERTRGNPYQLVVLAPGVLGAAFPSGDDATWRFSADGGRSWKDLKAQSGTIPAVPEGGWPACQEDNSGISRCVMYGTNPQTGVQQKLATQPPGMIPTGLVRTPAGSGIWVAGYVQQANRSGVSVSRDGGRTWSTHVFGQGEADYPKDINNQFAGFATVDGTTAYAVVTAVTNNNQNRTLIYHTTDGGATWQRADPEHTVPWVQHGDASYLAADGTHVMQTSIENPAEWYAGTTGAYTKPAPMTGLEAIDDMRQPVQTAGPGAYLTYDRAAVYTSADGLHWTRLPVNPS